MAFMEVNKAYLDPKGYMESKNRNPPKNARNLISTAGVKSLAEGP